MTTSNPLFPNDDGSEHLQPTLQHGKAVQPVSADLKAGNPAADMIRGKLNAIYADEPSADAEIKEVEAAAKPLSKHQQFMQQLQASGQSLAQVQTAWHNYYVGLPDGEKHEVWREFYEVDAHASHYARFTAAQQKPKIEEPLPAPKTTPQPTPKADATSNSYVVVADHQVAPAADKRSVADVRRQIVRRVSAGGKLQPKHHLQSLAFGLGLGALTLMIFLFSFFNQVIITPFIQPSRQVTNAPLIVSADSVAATSTPEVIIPKINVEIPVDYTQTSTDENVIENALENGVVHYPETVEPGQAGNVAIFGHSSNNIFNPGKYKFAFVLLHTLVVGDTFYLTLNGKVYVYQVISRDIVDPSDVGVLNAVPGQTATATLITCDPPGTSLKRLVVVGKQISPDPAANSAPATPAATAAAPTTLASNGPSLWSRLWSWL